ncbi:hypothetical protein NIES4071_98260 [Calothrix sp. NIES-4071]|nr:hypothetical protein NIES4071_98260 [Calothrix sp. NIES-4071]BAZ64090.1 hypothetical protein NIES4105_98190 [Calothrix sp. NIES-4105]
MLQRVNILLRILTASSRGTISPIEGYKSAKIMENSQRVQQENSEAGTPAPEHKPEYKPETVKSKHKSALRFFLRLIAFHPWLLVVALLGLFAGSAVLAVYSLGYAGRIEELHSNTTEEPEVDIVRPINSASSDENNNPFPLWVVIAIALSCGGGCLVISRWLNGSTLSKKSQKRVNRYEVRLAQRRNYQTEPLAPKKPPVFVPPKTSTQTPTTRKANTTVTILPPQSNSLGIRQEPLVQPVEARKQNPISFVVRK